MISIIVNWCPPSTNFEWCSLQVTSISLQYLYLSRYMHQAASLPSIQSSFLIRTLLIWSLAYDDIQEMRTRGTSGRKGAAREKPWKGLSPQKKLRPKASRSNTHYQFTRSTNNLSCYF